MLNLNEKIILMENYFFTNMPGLITVAQFIMQIRLFNLTFKRILNLVRKWLVLIWKRDISISIWQNSFYIKGFVEVTSLCTTNFLWEHDQHSIRICTKESWNTLFFPRGTLCKCAQRITYCLLIQYMSLPYFTWLVLWNSNLIWLFSCGLWNHVFHWVLRFSNSILLMKMNF